jgi:C4-dicarboxylate-specific signal transduction histidine kinase
MQLELQPHRISSIVESALEAVQAQFPETHIRIERHYAPELPEIMCDQQLCEQVFVNLIQNAFQAMNGSGAGREASLRIFLRPETSGGRPGVGATIEDSGPGVPPELCEQIFNPFFTSKKDGVGLGLSIVAKIVDDHHGWIRLDCEYHGGARFHLFLPVASS